MSEVRTPRADADNAARRPDAPDASTIWWRENAYAEMGARYAEKTIDAASDWASIVESGRRDIERAIAVVDFRVGLGLDALEVGCGLARLTANLGTRYRTVHALDISPEVVDEARRRCTADNVTFGVSSGVDLLPGESSRFDVVLSAETFHHVSPPILRAYFRDAFRLLRPGGQFAAHINVDQPKGTTRAATAVRSLLHRLGVKSWRGWPTNPAFGRQYHSAEWVLRELAEAGLRDARQRGDSDRQAWFLAEKPAS
ncbi:MAG: class I SAM-dependent methyltransferase [Burkholderiaceae bacterium]|jgi:SAM-dependent methyltransferase|nr:class I SAM-dependent methyltransferase [Burkholderiales bacterium]MCZ8098799.1 class I SAM-dependent methyltransferase [Burkholderiales bacterium]MCZ8337298.1 class I SAM-dependent methyltransferase [Burkholderiaceae bacterium]